MTTIRSILVPPLAFALLAYCAVCFAALVVFVSVLTPIAWVVDRVCRWLR